MYIYIYVCVRVSNMFMYVYFLCNNVENFIKQIIFKVQSMLSRQQVCIYIYIYIYMCVCVCVCVYVYMCVCVRYYFFCSGSTNAFVTSCSDVTTPLL